jgi:hypothetical protein
MGERATAAQRRIDVAQMAFDEVLPATPGTHIIAFNSRPFVLDCGVSLPPPDGSTALHLAIETAATFSPALLLVLSDGLPDDPESALAAARRLGCRVVTLFCGDPRNHEAAAFMTALAWTSSDGIGDTVLADLRQPQRFAGELRQLLLAGPDA